MRLKGNTAPGSGCGAFTGHLPVESLLLILLITLLYAAVSSTLLVSAVTATPAAAESLIATLSFEAVLASLHAVAISNRPGRNLYVLNTEY